MQYSQLRQKPAQLSRLQDIAAISAGKMYKDQRELWQAFMQHSYR